MVTIDGARLPPDAVTEQKGIAYIALRPVGLALDAEVAYDSKAMTATITTVLRQVVFHMGDPEAIVNGRPERLEAAARLIGGRVVVPLRALATAMGATIRYDQQAREVVMTTSAPLGPPPGVPTAPPVPTANTLEGTVTRVRANDAPPLVEITVRDLNYTIVVPQRTRIQFRDTRGAVTGEGQLSQVQPGDTLIATLDSSGRLLSVADIFSGINGTIASIAGQSMVLGDGKVLNVDASGVAITLDGKQATMASLAIGDLVSVRSDPKTGKVRVIVALSQGVPSTTVTATPGPSTAGVVRIESVADNASHAFRAGQTLHVSATGTPGAVATFDLSNVIVENAMKEVRPGQYDGDYVVQVGTNLVDAPIIVHLRKGEQSAQTVGHFPLNVITTPPAVKETAPAKDARINTARPNIYATFATVGGKGMDASSLRIWINGKDVSAQATRTAGFISYYPAADLGAGLIRVEVKGTDTAGNPLEYTWSFTIIL